MRNFLTSSSTLVTLPWSTSPALLKAALLAATNNNLSVGLRSLSNHA